MRDPNRIYPFCNELAALWSKYPDLRFGQIVSNIIRDLKMNEVGSDIFYMEDNEMMEIIEEYLG